MGHKTSRASWPKLNKRGGLVVSFALRVLTDRVVITNELNFVAFGIMEVQRTPPNPEMFSGFDLHTEFFQASFLSCEILQADLKSDMVNRR